MPLDTPPFLVEYQNVVLSVFGSFSGEALSSAEYIALAQRLCSHRVEELSLVDTDEHNKRALLAVMEALLILYKFLDHHMWLCDIWQTDDCAARQEVLSCIKRLEAFSLKIANNEGNDFPDDFSNIVSDWGGCFLHILCLWRALSGGVLKDGIEKCKQKLEHFEKSFEALSHDPKKVLHMYVRAIENMTEYKVDYDARDCAAVLENSAIQNLNNDNGSQNVTDAVVVVQTTQEALQVQGDAQAAARCSEYSRLTLLPSDMNNVNSLQDYMEFLKVCQDTSKKLCDVQAHRQSVEAKTKKVDTDRSAFYEAIMTSTKKVLMHYGETAATNLGSCFQVIQSWITELYTSDVLVTACDITCTAIADNGIEGCLQLKGNVGKVQQQERDACAVGCKKRPREMFDDMTSKRSKYSPIFFEAAKTDYESWLEAAKEAVVVILET